MTKKSAVPHVAPIPPNSIGSSSASSRVAVSVDEDLDRESVVSNALQRQIAMVPADVARLLEEFGLPDDYDVKHCIFPGECSLSETPFPGQPDMEAWGQQLPWGAGTRELPKGQVCRQIV